MRLLIIVLMGFVYQGVSAATEGYTEVECLYQVYKKTKVVYDMEGIVRIKNNLKEGDSYLTLEPPIISGFEITARILLTRFNSESYFPVTLHPRGDTASYLEFGNLAKDNEVTLSTNLGGVDYKLSCKIVGTN